MYHEYPLNRFSGSTQSTITVSSSGLSGGQKMSAGKHKGCCILALSDNHNPKALILLIIESNEWSRFGRLRTNGHSLVYVLFDLCSFSGLCNDLLMGDILGTPNIGPHLDGISESGFTYQEDSTLCRFSFPSNRGIQHPIPKKF